MTSDDDYALRRERAVLRDHVRQLLQDLDPQEGDYHLGYVGLLCRLYAILPTVIDAERQRIAAMARDDWP